MEILKELGLSRTDEEKRKKPEGRGKSLFLTEWDSSFRFQSEQIGEFLELKWEVGGISCDEVLGFLPPWAWRDTEMWSLGKGRQVSSADFCRTSRKVASLWLLVSWSPVLFSYSPWAAVLLSSCGRHQQAQRAAPQPGGCVSHHSLWEGKPSWKSWGQTRAGLVSVWHRIWHFWVKQAFNTLLCLSVQSTSREGGGWWIMKSALGLLQKARPGQCHLSF